MKRNIENITLIDTFSDYTTPGLIIFDEDIILTNLKLTYNFNELATVNWKIKKYFNLFNRSQSKTVNSFETVFFTKSLKKVEVQL